MPGYFRPACALAIAAAVCFAPGCGKKETPSAPASDPWAPCPFARHLPSGTEGFLWIRNPGAVWRETAASWSPLLDDPGLRASWEREPTGRIAGAFLAAPKTPPILEALASATDHEMFVALGAGTGTQLAALQQIKRLFEAARLRNLFTPLAPEDAPRHENVPLEELPEDLASAAFTEVIVPLPPAMQETLEKFVRQSAVPPILIGMKIPRDSSLPRLLDEWVAALPDKIPRDKVEAGKKGQLTRVRLPLSMLVPTAVAVCARDILGANIGDPYAATYILRDILSKVTTVSFGEMHGYFLISVGTENGLPASAEDSGESLADTPAMKRLEPALGDETVALFYADALAVSLAAAPPPISEYLDAAVESALEFAPAPAIEPLRVTAGTLRNQAAELFRSRVTAASGIVQHRAGTWRAELFGGSLAPRLASTNVASVLAPAPSVDLLWTEQWEEGYLQRLLDFGTGLASFSAEWVKALGPVFLDETQRARAEAILKLIEKPLAQLQHHAGKILGSALGTQMALAVSFDGTMPPPPLLSSAASQAVLPRVALAASLRDRELLSRSWHEIAAAPDGGVAPWPPPVATTNSSGATYAYPMPLAGPDLSVATTVGTGFWILGTSRSFNETLGAPATVTGNASVQTIEFSTAPLATFASSWSSALAADPSLASFTAGFFPENPATLAAAAEVLKTPRLFRYEAKWEQDMLHRVLVLRPQP